MCCGKRSVGGRSKAMLPLPRQLHHRALEVAEVGRSRVAASALVLPEAGATWARQREAVLVMLVGEWPELQGRCGLWRGPWRAVGHRKSLHDDRLL